MYDTTPLETIAFHHSMLTDKVRTESWLRAILDTVELGDVVLDVGSGTGVLAYFACLAGARHVYAIEQGPIAALAKEICHRNGFQDRVSFVNGWSTHIELPEQVDVIVTETIGNFAFDEGILGWIADAKERWLAKGGRIIPHSLELVVVPVEDLDAYALLEGFSHQLYTLDFSPARSIVANSLSLERQLSPGSFLSQPASLVRLELADVIEAAVSGEASFVASRDGIVHGIGGWFTSELVPGLVLTNAPPSRAPSWKHGLLPLEQALPVKAGERLKVWIQVGMDGVECHLQWRVAVAGATSNSREARQAEGSTRAGQLLVTAHVPGLDRMPARNTEGEIDLFILQSMDGATPLSEIARQTAARFPARFIGVEDLLEYVQSLAHDYGRPTKERSEPSTVARGKSRQE